MMEFTIRRDYFINQLNDTLKAISPRTTLPILTVSKSMLKITKSFLLVQILRYLKLQSLNK